MKVYIKNVYKQQTVRDIPFFKAIYVRVVSWCMFLNEKQEDKPIIRFLI